MNVTCPQCKTTYNLPDDKLRPGVKLRCTVCREVFALPVEGVQEEAVVEPEPLTFSEEKKSGHPVLIFLLLALLGAGVAGAWHYTDVLDPVKNVVKQYIPLPEEPQAQTAQGGMLVMVSELKLDKLSWHPVINEKLGKLIVCEGVVINGFDAPRELIKVEVALQDEAGKTLLAKTQFAGSMITDFQLEVLDKAEIEQRLSNQLDILTNNTNIQPGGSVPFTVVFYDIPEGASRFNVIVVEAGTAQQ